MLLGVKYALGGKYASENYIALHFVLETEQRRSFQ